MRGQLLGQATIEISAALAARGGLGDDGALRLVSMIRCAAPLDPPRPRGGASLEQELAQNLHAVLLTPDALVPINGGAVTRTGGERNDGGQ